MSTGHGKPVIALAARQDADAPAQSRPSGRRWLSLAVLLTGNFVTILDLFIVNVALASIERGLGASLAEIQLIMVGYSTGYGVLLMNGARLGDLFGRRRVFLFGMAVFTAASLLCGVAGAPVFLIAARIMQGIGAALLMPQVYASIRVLFEGDQRRRAFSVMGAVQGMAGIVSQLIGGYLIEHSFGGLGWRLVFLVNIPVGLAVLAFGRWTIEETRAPVATKLDLWGAFVGALGLSLLLFPPMEGREYNWPWWSIAGPALSFVVLYYFVRYEESLSKRGGVPIIEVSLLRNRDFVRGLCAAFLFFTTISSYSLSLTMFLQVGLGMSPLLAGEVFTPSAIGFFVGSLAAARLATAIGQRALLLGMVVFLLGLGLSIATGLSAPQNLAALITALVLNGLGQGIVIPLALNVILSSVSEAQAGIGSGVLSTMQIIGSASGVTIVGVIFFSLLGQGQPSIQAAVYGYAFGVATLYNLAALFMSLVLFSMLRRGA